MAHTPLGTPYTTCTHTCARRADTHTTYIHTQSPYRANRAVPLLPLGLLVQLGAAEVEDSWALVTAEHLPSLVTHPAVGVIFSSVTTAAHYLTAMEIWQTEAKEEMVSNLLTPHHMQSSLSTQFKQTHTHTHTHTHLSASSCVFSCLHRCWRSDKGGSSQRAGVDTRGQLTTCRCGHKGGSSQRAGVDTSNEYTHPVRCKPRIALLEGSSAVEQENETRQGQTNGTSQPITPHPTHPISHNPSHLTAHHTTNHTSPHPTHPTSHNQSHLTSPHPPHITTNHTSPHPTHPTSHNQSHLTSPHPPHITTNHTSPHPTHPTSHNQSHLTSPHPPHITQPITPHLTPPTHHYITLSQHPGCGFGQAKHMKW